MPLLTEWDEAAYFFEAFLEQNDNKRLIFAAFEGAELRGYAHYNRFPGYAPFRRLGIPEIQDLFVIPDARRQGIGALLVAKCEEQARHEGKADIGIGVGVAGKFGAAQRLYTRLGYLPDGAGVVFDRQGVTEGDMKPVDDRLCLMLMKAV